MIRGVKIENFKCMKGSFTLDFKKGINILVGNNEAGKSTILEAIHLALSGIFRGKLVKGNLTQYLFNYEVVKEYIENVNDGKASEPPYILIELYLDEGLHILVGDMFILKESSVKSRGVSLQFELLYNNIVNK